MTHSFQTRSWHSHPKLKGRFVAKHPSELLVIVHEGGPRLTTRRPEVVPVEVLGCEGDIFTGRMLHQPIQLHTLRLGQQIRFVVPAAARYPVLVSEKYLQERPFWTIQPCKKCGFSELFDPPSELRPLLFPSATAGADRSSFKTSCPLCGGPLTVLAKAEPKEIHAAGSKKRSR